MEDKQLEMFEDRINRAIGFIENLKAKEKTLEDEKDTIERKVEDLEEQLASKDQRIEELLESQVFLKNKIEAVLGKLESLANFDPDIAEGSIDSSTDSISTFGYGKTDNYEEKVEDTPVENRPDDDSTAQSGEIYVEENIVDLKEDVGPEKDIDQQNTTIFTPPVDQSPLFDNTENDQVSGDDDSSDNDDFFTKTEQEHKPLSDNPFIEM